MAHAHMPRLLNGWTSEPGRAQTLALMGGSIVDVEGFRYALERSFEGSAASQFADLFADVEGLAVPNKLAVLNLAASFLGADDAYVEVGTFKGLSLIAAMMGNATGRF